jgi:hypothetical protein
MKVLTICGDVYCSQDQLNCLSAMILSWSLRRQGRPEEALASITRAYEGYARIRGADHTLTKECERRTIALSQEIEQARKPRISPFPRVKRPHEVLSKGSADHDLSLPNNDLVWTPKLLALITVDICF